MWYVIGLIWIVLIVGIISVYNRRQRQGNAGRAEKMAALLADLKSSSAAGMSTSRATAAPVAPAVGGGFRKKPRLLPSSTALLYYVFRTGLPDHEIFTGLTVADVLDAGPASSMTEPEQLRKLLAQRLDLVVCTKQLEVVAGVVIGAGADGVSGSGVDFIANSLQAAGIRMVRIDPAAAPRHHQVRGLVYGEGG
jgi:hypothetical protein